MFVAARGICSRDRTQALRALVPIAVGHAIALALVAATLALGLSMNHMVVQALAGGLLVVVAVVHLLGRAIKQVRSQAGHAGLALWSLVMSTMHGAGVMLVPALVPLCIADTPSRAISASGPLTLALAAVGVHTAAMLAVTGVIAIGVCRGVDALDRAVRSQKVEPRPTAQAL
jgi:cytochrome bd-type quinol oxidase subunit 2